MDPRVSLLFFAATAISLVDCRCYNVRLGKVDYDAVCEKWWENAKTESDSGVKSCINLIEDKCPKMINEIEITVKKDYFVDHLTYEIWTYRVDARRTGTYSSSVFYFETRTKKLCSDNNGKDEDCDYWWKVAREPRAENKYKERCIERIKKHCGNKISKVGEVDGYEVTRCWRGYDVKTVTFKYNNEGTASYNIYVSSKKC